MERTTIKISKNKQDRKKLITELYLKFGNFSLVAKELGITREALQRWIKRNGGRVSVIWENEQT